jgi:predicted acetyltransferase
MDSMLNYDISSIVYRHLEKHEQQQALDMWYSIFKVNPGCDERYFSSDASPSYQEGDTLSAWHNGKLVSTVHIRRLTLRSSENNEEYLCAVICNVATVVEYRRQGLSRHLLKMATDKMEKSNEFDISMLGTGNHHHYATLGWAQVSEPNQVMIDWKMTTSSDTDARWRSVSDVLSHDVELLLKIHSDKPRIYQIDRSPPTMFQHWVKCEWQNDAAIICLYEHEKEQGYVVIGHHDSETDVCVLEWRASNSNLEQKLLSLAASEIRQRHGQTKAICLFALPQHMTIDQLTECAGLVKVGIHQDAMMRNIRLSNDVYEKIKAAFSDGRAVYWSGDYC